MGIIRTFHPVGQGAFYSERLFHDGKEFTIVYDCGSSTLGEKKMKTKVKSSFPKGHTIDILFLSHFHGDHISGIEFLKEHCTIKKVIIPFMDDEAKALVRVVSAISGDTIGLTVLENPQAYFEQETQVVSIEEVDLEDDNSVANTEEIESLDTVGESTRSGAVFKPLEKFDWYLIPFNYQNGNRKTQFLTTLANDGIRLEDLDTVGKILSNKAKIVKAYNLVDGDLNSNSMVLYSGSNMSYRISTNMMGSCYCYDCSCDYICDCIESGCLYTGDSDFKDDTVVSSLFRKLGNFASFIGTLQVPHHGSIKNWNKKLLQRSTEIAVLSYGDSNSYGHPSDFVVGELIAAGKGIVRNTQDREAIHVQFSLNT